MRHPGLPHLVALACTAVAAAAGGCAGSAEYIPGTRVQQSSENRGIIDQVEDYRMAVERKDVGALVEMASKNYWDDAGTPASNDDYGYQGLQEILNSRFQKVDAIRYSMKYVDLKRKGGRAYVDVLIDASFTITDARGQEVRTGMRDQNELVLEWDGKRWRFLSGM